MCVSDAAGAKATGGTLPDPDGTANACVVVRFQIIAMDDPPVITIDGQIPATPIPGIIYSYEDQVLTTTVGFNDSDGLSGSTTWRATYVSGPSTLISTIEFSFQSSLSLTAELWDMLITPNLNQFGDVVYDISVITGPSTSDTQRVTFSIAEVNDIPFFSASPCSPSTIVTDEGFLQKIITLSESSINDTSDTDEGVAEDYVWSLAKVDYDGAYYDETSNPTRPQVKRVSGSFIPLIAEANTLSVVNDQNDHSIFEIQVTQEGSLILNSFEYASITSAFLYINVSDRGGLSNSYTTQGQCGLVINDLPNSPQIDSAILATNRELQEDVVFQFPLGAFELDPFNPKTTEEEFDSNLQWSVRLAEPTTMFSIDVQYPTSFRAYLQNRNEVEGLNDRISIGDVNPDISTTSTGPDSIPGTDDTPNILNAVDDLLYISTAPDVHGTFALELSLKHVGPSSGATPATTILTFSVVPVNDPPRITILDSLNPSVEVTSDMITMPVSESIRRINLTTWENDARDFVYPTTDGNPNGSKIFGTIQNLLVMTNLSLHLDVLVPLRN